MPLGEGDIVYAAMPCYSHPHPYSAKQFYVHALNPAGKYAQAGVQLQVDDYGCSLLGHSFDNHWATALNMQADGKPVKRFAMLHNDVGPDNWWLDTLLEDMDRTGADVVSALIAIKDLKGLTSTAIDDPSDRWDVLRRITVTEAMRLPEVFDARDCGYPDNMLLVNTGCWVADFTKPWRHAQNPDGTLKVNFEIRNAILKNVEGKYETKVCPEDWDFSRKVQRLGGKVLCSRRLRIRHYGELPFPNWDAWGSNLTDDVFAKKFETHLLSNTPAVRGWMTTEEGEALAELAKDKNVLEIGSYCGLSTVWMARVARRVTCIDTFDGKGTPKPEDTYDEFHANLRKYGVFDKTSIIKGKTVDVMHSMEWWPNYDLVFVDGAHDRESLLIDLKLAFKAVKPEGCIAFHDYGNLEDHPDVTNVLNNRLGRTLERVAQVGSLLITKPIMQLEKEQGHGQRATATAAK